MSNVEDLDLNIENYSLEDILRLLRLPINFTRAQLKDAKRMVLMTHPDKSGKPQEVFLFFSAAYKLIHQVFTFRSRSDDACASRTEYDVTDLDDKSVLAPSVVNKFKKSRDFNERFNALWEKHKEKAFGDQEGYEDWLKEEEEDAEGTPRSLDEVNRRVSDRKEQLRSLVVRKDVSSFGSVGSNGHSSLTRENPGCFEAPIFGGLQYDDVRRAYTESVVPVTDEDYESHRKFSNIDELQRFRREDFDKSFSSSDHDHRLQKMRLDEETASARRAYDLAKQDEEMRKVSAGWSASLLSLMYNESR